MDFSFRPPASRNVGPGERAFHYLRGNGRRQGGGLSFEHGRHRRGDAPPEVADRSPPEPARAVPGGRDLLTPRELPRDRPLAAEPGDGPAPRQRARRAAPRAQRAAPGRGLRSRLPRDRPRRPRDGEHARGGPADPEAARALSRPRHGPPLEPGDGQPALLAVPGDAPRRESAARPALRGAARASPQHAPAALRPRAPAP